MKQVHAFAVWAGLIASCVFFANGALCAKGRSGRVNKTLASEKDRLIGVEHAWGNALLKRDVAGWSRCLADEWVLITSDGSRVTKPMALADLKSGALKIESFRLDDVTVRLYGNTAVVRESDHGEKQTP